MKLNLSLLLLLAFSLSLHAQENTTPALEALQKENADLTSQLAELHDELQAIRSENARLKQDLARLRAEGPIPAPKTKISEKAKRAWSTNVALGGSYNRGNTRTTNANIKAEFDYTKGPHHLEAMTEASYGEADDVRSEERIRSNIQYNHEIDERWYGFIGTEIEYDAVQELEYRVTAFPGLGYYVVKTDAMKLRLEAGPAMQFEKFENIDEANSTAGRLRQYWKWQINEQVKLFEEAEYITAIDDADTFRTRLLGGIESKLTDLFKLRFTAEHRHNSAPPANTDYNDLALISSIVFDY